MQMGFDVGVTAGAQHRHKDLGRLHFAGLGMHDGDRLTGIVDKQPLPRHMAQPHRGLQMAGPLAIVFAKLAVSVAVGMGRAVFVPQQAQRDALAPQFRVDVRPIRQRDAPAVVGSVGGNKRACSWSSVRSAGSGQLNPAALAR